MSALDLADLPLVDHHCHSVTTSELDRAQFEGLLTEGEAPAPGLSSFDSMVGLSVRRWCAPVLDLPPHASPDQYLARRAQLGGDEVTRRLLRASRTARLLVDTGFRSDELLTLDALAAVADAPATEVVRLERLAEQLSAGADASTWAQRMTDGVREAAARTVAFKSIAAYRVGLDLPERPPDAAEVRRAAGRYLGEGGGRLADPVLVAAVVHAAVETGLPIQFHTGFGDADEDLRRANPARLAGFCRSTGAPVVLLHCWPYHREAAWAAHVLPNVYLDVGLAATYVGARASHVLAETLEVAPFGKVLYSSDAFGLAELYLLGALRFRRACEDVLGGLVDQGELTASDAQRVAELMASGNAVRLYGLDQT